LTPEELQELKDINLWATQLDDLNLGDYSENVQKVMDMIKINYERTVARTAEITAGKAEQDPYDVLYSVPPAIVKLFIEQSFDRPEFDNLVVVEQKEIPDEQERKEFYINKGKEVIG